MYQDLTESISTETTSNNLTLFGELNHVLQSLSVLLVLLLTFVLLNLWQLASIETIAIESRESSWLMSLPTSSKSESPAAESSGKQQDQAENSTSRSWLVANGLATYQTLS